MAAETTKKSLGKYWLYFFISLIACIALLVFLPEWSWLAFPFVLTFLVMAFDAM